jgi:L-alanine-DL-glutamate epimerase-like enolase superfamily enzyme
VNIKLHPYQLEFVFPFRIAHGVRTHTDALFVELEHEGVTAFGEATFPPYLSYTRESAMSSLSTVDLADLYNQAVVIDPAKSLDPYNNMQPPALAALDMALWSLKAKLENTTIRSLLGIAETFSAPRTYTLSVCDREEMSKRIAAGRALGFDLFKLKLNGKDDDQMLSDFRILQDGPFAVDANQSWTDILHAIDFGRELADEGCILIEQPFKKDWPLSSLKLRDATGIPVIADESCQRSEDIDMISPYFSGINIKLQKCGGITPAYKMIKHARAKGLKILIGCMSESIIGCSAGEVLSPLCDWNDLDGVALIKDVPFRN